MDGFCRGGLHPPLQYKRINIDSNGHTSPGIAKDRYILQKKFNLENLDATYSFGQNIGQIIQSETLIALNGELGSGKTTLTQAIAKGLQIEELVVSPTFVMINEYHSGRLPLYHLDLYRFFDQSASKVIHDTDEPSISFLLSQLEEITQTKSVVIIEWAQILWNQFGIDLNNLCQNGYLSLDLKANSDNDQLRIATLTTTGKKDQRYDLLFSDLCELSKRFLSN